jgi:WD40 repeat protein
MTAPSLRVAALGLTALLTAALGAAVAADGDDTSDAALKALAERCKGAAERDRERLISDLLAFRRTYPGTKQAVEAARLQASLPSALDKLDAAAIPMLERFDWQPKELVAVVGEHRGRQGAPVTGVAWSGDGSMVVSGGGPWVRFWDPVTLRLHAAVGHGATLCVAVTRDGKTAAAGSAYGVIGVWDVSTPEKPVLRHSITAASVAVYSVAFSPDGKHLAAGFFDNMIHIYDLEEKEAKALTKIAGHEKAVYAVAYSPDGKTLASGGADMAVKLWSVAGGTLEEKAVLLGHAKEVASVAFNPAGTLLASSDHAGVIRLWPATATGKAKEKAQCSAAGSGIVHGLAFSANGQSLAAACGDSHVHIWGATTTPPREKMRLEGHAGSANSVAVSPDSKQFVTGSADWTVRSWDVSGAKPKDRFQPWSHLSHIYAVAFAPDGQNLATGSEDRVLRVWDVTKTEPKTRHFLKGDSAAIYTVAYAPDGKSLAAGGNHKTVRLWEAASGRSLKQYTGHPTHMSNLMFTPDGRLLLGQSGKQIVIWNAQKADVARRLETVETNINGAALSPDGRVLLTANGAHLYRDGKPVYKTSGAPQYTDCLLRLWDVETGEETAADKSSTVPIYSAAFAPDGKQAFSGAYEAVWRRWDFHDKKLSAIGEVKGGSGYAGVLLASPDGRTVVTRGLDGVVALWDAETGRRLQDWAFREYVGGMAYSSDSRYLAVGLATGVVYILRLEGSANAAASQATERR